MKLFPYILTRIGGGTYEHFNQTDFSYLTGQVELLIAKNAEKVRLKQQLCKHLLQYIILLKNTKIQNHVQNVRREIYNDRSVKPHALSNAKQHLTEELNSELDEYISFTLNIKHEQENAAVIYENLLYLSRQHIQHLAQDEILQKGLVLSSHSLLNSLADYTKQDPAAFRKKEYKTELSLLKYLTRMCTKTSPFSTFNNLAIGKFSLLPEDVIQVNENHTSNNQVSGYIRINNNLFKYLKQLLTANREVYRHLHLRPNPTIKENGDHYAFLTNHNNVEAFQRIQTTPVMTMLLQLALTNKAGIRFATLVLETCKYVDAPENEIEQYLSQLINYGFFEFDLGVSGTDPDWDLKLTEQMQYLEDQHIAHINQLRHTLMAIRAMAEQYAESSVIERQRIINNAFNMFRTSCMHLHDAAELPEFERRLPEELQAEARTSQKAADRKKKEHNLKEDESILVIKKEKEYIPNHSEVPFKHLSSTYFSYKPEQLFYEDTIREVAVQFDEGKLKQLVHTMFNLLQKLRKFSSMADERQLMLQYFVQKYGASARVNLLHFYEDYYKEIKKPEAEAKNKDETLKKSGIASVENPEVLDDASKKQVQLKESDWLKDLISAVQNNVAGQTDQVNLSSIRIRDIKQAVLISKEAQVTTNSYGAFIQFFREKDENGEWQLKGVLNATMAGYGKMLSRFLHIFPEKVIHTIRAWNMDLQDENSLFIENCDASYFNANLHPPMMPYEIRMPGGHNNLSLDQQLPVCDFEVMVNESCGELQLFHKNSAKRAYVFDLGFQGRGRSQLFQLLDKFTKAEYLFVSPLVWAVNTAADKNNSVKTNYLREDMKETRRIIMRPRIVYEDLLVIQRQGWYVPKELIPQRQPDMNDWSYYYSLNEWRKANGIADEVYITISPNRNQIDAEPETRKKFGSDDYKPQYIHFNDPLFILLFEKLLSKVHLILKIEEMLPNSKDLLKINHQRFVTEFLVQWHG